MLTAAILVVAAKARDLLEALDLVRGPGQGAGARQVEVGAALALEAREYLDGDDAGVRRHPVQARAARVVPAGGDAGDVGAVLAPGDGRRAVGAGAGADLLPLAVRADAGRERGGGGETGLGGDAAGEERGGRSHAAVEDRDRPAAAAGAGRPGARRVDQRDALRQPGLHRHVLLDRLDQAGAQQRR